MTPVPRPIDSIANIVERIAAFDHARDWEQFHSVKNLLLGLVSEVGELVTPFQWLPAEEIDAWLSTPENRKAAEAEIADVFIHLVQLAQLLDIDLIEATNRKVDSNAHRYPVATSRGSAQWMPHPE